ncbi:hypothetical protein H0H93_013641 [Arthromyces matolae]|nr:hypothetical protein H0H93_013641 [Arthromyces matolae]
MENTDSTARHCATHQIRIILVSCVVITSLFYPALAIYTSSQHKALSVIDNFISRTTISEFDAQRDLHDLWAEGHGLRIHDDAVTRAKCGAGRALRVERLLIQGNDDDDEGALSRQTLLSTLELENRLESLISNGDTPCLKRADGKCFVVSPLLFWEHDKQALLSDPDISNTLGSFRNISVGGVLVTPRMVLARRELHDPHASQSDFDFATFLAVTYFFPDSECLDTIEHESWLQTVHRARAEQQGPILEVQEPTVFGLEYERNKPKPEGWSALSTFLYAAYLGFFVYVGWSAGKMTAVHSRLGITLTALVEIAVSTITSLSVCALIGFKVTMVPWELLPIVIVFVGAENMFNLVDAVGKTSVSLSVKQRIAEGLSRAGTSNTLKVVSYNIILGIIAVFSVGAIRQFCSFAIVVLVAHWFLAHTFFLAVLSIDLQRLTLDELLRHGASTPFPHTNTIKEDNTKKPRSAWQRLIFTAQTLLKGRATANLSLLMLLTLTATLYYTTSVSVFNEDQIPVFPFQDRPRLPHQAVDDSSNRDLSAWYTWKTLNPAQAPLLHLRVETPIIVSFRSDTVSPDSFKPAKKPRARFSMRTFRSILWILKIMIFPILATTTALWGLLLYLLKDAELLEAQRNRGEPDSHDTAEDSKVPEGQISFSTLPRSFTSDVELIAASKDGNVVVSVGLYNEITIAHVDRNAHFSVDAADVLLRTASTSSAISALTSVAVDNDGCYCAVGTGAGAIAVWSCKTDDIHPLPLLSLDNVSAAVTEIQFTSISGVGLCLLATYESGVAAKWSLESDLAVAFFSPPRRAPVVRTSLVRVHPLDHHLLAFSLDDGTLEVVDTQNTDILISQNVCVQAGDPLNTVTKVHACQAELGGSSRLILAAATGSGLVTLWDASTGECISVFEDAYGRISHLRVTPVQHETCRFCGQLPLESVSVAFSVDPVVHFFRLYINDENRRCSCSRHPLRNISARDNLGRRSRNNSITSQSSQTGAVSPSIPRARLATTFETSPFPVSGHGVHSRRATEKETGRRSTDTLTVPFPGEDFDHDNIRPFISTHSFWRDAVLVRETDITCERGGWGVNGRRVIGVRRKPRPQGNAQGGTTTTLRAVHSQGLTPATLERWEIWTFDPSLSRLQSSLLAALVTKDEVDRTSFSSSSSSSTCSGDRIPRLPFTRVSPMLAAPTHALAGFGNTVGIFRFCCS